MSHHEVWKHHQSTSRVHARLGSYNVLACAWLMLLFETLRAWPPPMLAALSFFPVPVPFKANQAQVFEGSQRLIWVHEAKITGT